MLEIKRIIISEISQRKRRLNNGMENKGGWNLKNCGNFGEKRKISSYRNCCSKRKWEKHKRRVGERKRINLKR